MATDPRRRALERRSRRAGGRRGRHRGAALTARARRRRPVPDTIAAPLLDTHAWVWWLEQDARLGGKAIAALDSLPADRRPFLCDISLWEVATLVERGRLILDVPFDDWLAAAAHPRSVRVLGVTPRVAAELARLPESFHRDPADRVIVATGRAEHLPVLTHDEQIRRARLVTLWQP